MFVRCSNCAATCNMYDTVCLRLNIEIMNLNRGGDLNARTTTPNMVDNRDSKMEVVLPVWPSLYIRSSYIWPIIDNCLNSFYCRI